MSTLTEKAILVKLSIKQWSTSRFDKEVTATANKHYNAQDGAGRYTKVLIARDAITEIRKSANEARTFHYENTLPWKDDGYRMLPSANYMDYTQAIRALKNKFEKAVIWIPHICEATDKPVRRKGTGCWCDYGFNTFLQ